MPIQLPPPTPASIGAVPISRLINSANGILGGGDLSADLDLELELLTGGANYTPTYSNLLNATTILHRNAWFMRVGNTVHVGGAVTITPTNPSTVLLGVSLPIASNLSSDYDLAGMICNAAASTVGGARGRAADDIAQIVWNAPGTSAVDYWYNFSYPII